MKPSLIITIMSLSCLASVQGATIQIDFNRGPSGSNPTPTQTGWEEFSAPGTGANNKTQSYSGYPMLAAGNISIITSGTEFARNYNNGGNPAPDFPGTALDNMYNDLILRNDVGGNVEISIGGLLAGDYIITTHHLAAAASTATVSTFDLLVTDADSAGFSQDEGNFEMGRSGVSSNGFADFDPTVVSFTVTSNGTDNIVLRLDGTSIGPGGTTNWIGINGLEIANVVPIPEPSSTALLGLGGLALILRRRK